MSSDQFTDILRRWAEVFMHRSMRDFHQFTRKSGLSMSQLNALFYIYHGGACGVSDLGEHLGVTSAASSQMIDRLVQLDLLQRSEDPLDRRNKCLALTDKGRAVIRESIEAPPLAKTDHHLTLTSKRRLPAPDNPTQAAQRLEE
jgi:DNA-binding MarR family transcriptional regulator